MSALSGAARPIQLANGPVDVLFTARRLIAIEDRYGSWASLDEAWAAKPTAVTAFLLWEGAGHPGKEDDAPQMIDGTPVNEVKVQLVDILRECLNGPGVAAPVDPTTAEPSTPGENS